MSVSLWLIVPVLTPVAAMTAALALRDPPPVHRRLSADTGRFRPSVEFPRPPFPAMVCSPELSHAAAVQLRGIAGVAAVKVLNAALPFNGDDFALFLAQVPGAMFYIGVANPDVGANGIPHVADFAADERAIGLGVRAMAGLLSSRLEVLRSRTALD